MPDSSLPVAVGHPRRGQEMDQRLSSDRSSGRRRQDLPRSRGTPVLACSALRPRWDRAALAKSRARQPLGGPSVPRTTSAPTMIRITGLNHAACKLAVYASQRGLPRRHARLASGRWLACRAGLVTRQGLLNKVSALLCYIASSLSELRGATEDPVYTPRLCQHTPCVADSERR